MRKLSTLSFCSLLFAGHIPNAAADSPILATSQPNQNVYLCQIFEPNQPEVKVQVDPNQQVYVHPLQDGVHELEIHWWSWTLNVSLRTSGVIPEMLGAASHTNLKLRSHEPQISVWCDKQ
jgi:hypothetical protein